MNSNTTLIEPRELHSHLGDPAWTVVDCRFDLARPDAGEAGWRAAHIPGAVHAHLDRDLSGTLTPMSGRHPLPGHLHLAETFGRLGIGNDSQVVAYDESNGAYAARLWWLLRWLGHTRVAVLNGGLRAWQAAGLPVESGDVAATPRTFRPTVRPGAWVSTAELETELPAGRLALVDARAADRFAGRNETLDPVAGHVPGARNHPFAGNLDADGRFLPAEELRKRWLATLRGESPARTACMCGSGVTACHNLLALEVAGLSGARLYAGSWSEWIRDPTRPVATGAEGSDTRRA
jgi:thiosulfate/3-mercaptopyruvate sulfurtransferase